MTATAESSEAKPAAAKVPRPRSGSSLVARLLWLAAGWSLVALLATGLAFSTFFRTAQIARVDEAMTELDDSLYAGATVGPDGQVYGPALTDARATRAYSGRYWEIAELAPGGKLHALARSRSLWDSELSGPPDAAALKPGGSVFYDTMGPKEEPLRGAAVMAQIPGRSAPLIFLAAEDRTPVDTAIKRFAATAAVALVLVGVVLVAGVFVAVRLGLQPLFVMGREIADVRQGKAQRLVRAYPHELEPLAGELNALLDHNQEVVERQRTHVGNLAHALKTPISVMLAEAERPSAGLAEVVVRQAAAMRDHVEHHLRRARAAARSQGFGERTPVAATLDELARTLERIFRHEGVSIDWRASDSLAFQGEKQDLMEMAGNMLENACKWSHGHVRARAEAGRAGRFTLMVEDDGPGLPPEQRAEVLRRGARLDEEAPGSGLGLSIVDELARAYGGALTLSDSPMGGLKIALDLPRAEV